MHESPKILINEAVNLREQGQLEEALTRFEELRKAFEATNSFRDLVTVLGNLRITHTLLSDVASDTNSRLAHLEQASACIDDALAIMTEHSEEVPQGNRPIFLVHSASIKSRRGNLHISSDERVSLLESALADLDLALQDFPGSRAHRAWPLALKARILCDLEDYESALQVISRGKADLASGRAEELQANGGERNLLIWESGLMLIEARVLYEQGNAEEALALLQGVLEMTPPLDYPDTLAVRKEEARRLIKEYSQEA